MVKQDFTDEQLKRLENERLKAREQTEERVRADKEIILCQRNEAVIRSKEIEQVAGTFSMMVFPHCFVYVGTENQFIPFGARAYGARTHEATISWDRK